MDNHNQKQLGDAIREFIRVYKLEDKLLETQLFSSWERIMGKHIARYTDRISLRKKVLTVYLTSSVMRSELTMAKNKIIKMLNKEVGKEIITDIHFR